MVGSGRTASDGCVYVGRDVSNDIVVPAQEQGVGDRHFMVKYSVKAKSYYIKDLGEGTGTFVKIESPLALRQGYIVSFGDSHIVINLRIKGRIQLKFLDGPKTDQTLYCPPNNICG